jgi:hypothetical protein
MTTTGDDKSSTPHAFSLNLEQLREVDKRIRDGEAARSEFVKILQDAHERLALLPPEAFPPTLFRPQAPLSKIAAGKPEKKPDFLSMESAIDCVCRDLPEGWLVSLRMEQGAAWVVLNDPQGRDIETDDANSLPIQLLDALNVARRRMGKPKAGK